MGSKRWQIGSRGPVVSLPPLYRPCVMPGESGGIFECCSSQEAYDNSSFIAIYWGLLPVVYDELDLAAGELLYISRADSAMLRTLEPLTVTSLLSAKSS